MNRIQSLFQSKEQSVLSFYCTAGYPALKDTVPLILELEASGADMIEIGIPFSDPLADGPVIQQSSQTALTNGMSIPELFLQLKDIRQKTNIPLLLMGYLNPIMQYGIRSFCKDASTCGIDGLIIPDLPLLVYEVEWKSIMEEYQLNMIFLITPHTTSERIREIDRLSKGFIYMVTSAATTGSGLVFDDSLKTYFRTVQNMKLSNPIIAGFGISNKADFDQVCHYTNGAIIGSGLIRVLGNCSGGFGRPVRDFVEPFY
ncbi:MAG: tryptophan synthase subunit alpha [Taibaiella sp.]